MAQVEGVSRYAIMTETKIGIDDFDFSGNRDIAEPGKVQDAKETQFKNDY